MQATEQTIRDVVQQVLSQLGRSPHFPISSNGHRDGAWGVFKSVDQAVDAANEAFRKLSDAGMDARRKIVDIVKRITSEQAEELGRLELEETKIGRLDHKIEKAAYKKEEPKLREALLNAQYDLLRERRFSTLILIAGVDGAGKGETVNLLNEWMDPRHIEVTGFPPPTDEERERPPLWRFWRPLPPKGKIGIFFGAWHTEPIVKRVTGEFDEAAFAQRIGEIIRFEKMLVDEGVLLLKFWFHLSKAQQKARLKELEKNPRTHWRVTKADWKLYDQYNSYVNVCESFLRETSSGEAPWLVVPGADDRYRSLVVGREILDALSGRLARKPGKSSSKSGPPPLPAIDKLNVLRSLDLNQPMAREEYKDELEKWQSRLNALVREPSFHETSVVAVFEGNDAAGKGGAIRRVTRALDARFYKNTRDPTSGGSGAKFRAGDSSPSSIVPGMGGFWSSESRGSPPRRTGCGRTPKSSILSRNSFAIGPSSSSSGWRSARKSN